MGPGPGGSRGLATRWSAQRKERWHSFLPGATLPVAVICLSSRCPKLGSRWPRLQTLKISKGPRRLSALASATAFWALRRSKVQTASSQRGNTSPARWSPSRLASAARHRRATRAHHPSRSSCAHGCHPGPCLRDRARRGRRGLGQRRARPGSVSGPVLATAHQPGCPRWPGGRAVARASP